MTDKSISQRICELCGIEPLKDENAYFTGNLGKYPDFENNNNNFVKLLNLKLDSSFRTPLEYITFNYYSATSTESLLRQILSELEFDWNPVVVKQIKKAIRRADWEY